VNTAYGDGGRRALSQHPDAGEVVPEDELEVLYECEARYHLVKNAPQSATTVEGVRRSAECAGLLLTPKEGRYESQDELVQRVMFCPMFHVPSRPLATSDCGVGWHGSWMNCSAVLFSHHEGGRASMGAAWHAPCTVQADGDKWLVTFFKVREGGSSAHDRELES
jgi:hypothetical protein